MTKATNELLRRSNLEELRYTIANLLKEGEEDDDGQLFEPDVQDLQETLEAMIDAARHIGLDPTEVPS